MNIDTRTARRPVSVPHLVFGLIFTGLAIVWTIGEATNADLPRTAIGFPAVLIGAGLAGLIGAMVNARNRNHPVADFTEINPATDDAAMFDDTTVIEEN